jgi:hypothetical protein
MDYGLTSLSEKISREDLLLAIQEYNLNLTRKKRPNCFLKTVYFLNEYEKNTEITARNRSSDVLNKQESKRNKLNQRKRNKKKENE